MGASGIHEAVSRHTPIRERIYQVLLSQPREEWTVRTLKAAAGPDISISMVRDTIYILIAAAAMTVVPGHRAVTVRLTATGRNQLQSLEQAWQNRRPVSRISAQPSPAQHPNQRRTAPTGSNGPSKGQ
jgi:hypothetical protein